MKMNKKLKKESKSVKRKTKIKTSESKDQPVTTYGRVRLDQPKGVD